MKYIIYGALGLLTTSAQAESLKIIAPPSNAEIQNVEKSIGGSMPWPKKAKPIEDYDRYYYWDKGQTDILQAQFKLAKRQGEGKTFSEADYRGYVADGGCSIVNLAYFGRNDPRNRLRCGGR